MAPSKKKIKKIDFSKIKFGRLPKIDDARTFEISNYLDEKDLPRIPKKHNWGKKIKRNAWGDMGNLKINLCTCAAAGHSIMAWTSNTGRLKKPSNKSILNAYRALTHYNPKTHEHDDGVEALKCLKYWRKTGIGGHQIVAFAKLKDKDRKQLIQTIYLFGGCYVGLNLPKFAEEQYNTTKKWAIPKKSKKKESRAGSWFGHAVLVTGYKDGELRIITWGEEMIMTMDFWERYGEESYGVFSESFIKNDKTPTGVDINVLRNDLENLQKKKQASQPA
jgi:hypothetical protein